MDLKKGKKKKNILKPIIQLYTLKLQKIIHAKYKMHNMFTNLDL